MRVLIVSQYFHPENFRINQLAVALKEKGHDVVIITAQPNYPSGVFFSGYSAFAPLRERYEGMDVFRVPIFPRGRGRSWELVLNYISFVISSILFGLPRVRGRFDVCIAWCSSPITIAIPAIFYRFLRRTPVAVWVQDLWPETFFAVTKSKSRLLSRALSRLVRWIYSHIDQIWIQSPAYAESVRAHGGRDDQVHFVPNWAEDLYDCSQWTELQPDSIPPRSLVFAGNLGRAQGLESLLETACLLREIVPPVHFVFVGDGVLRSWLANQVQERGLEKAVTLLPRRPAAEMPRVLKPAAALLVTLGSDDVFMQTIPSKVQSCLAAGRPILASLGGEPARTIQKSHAGIVVSPESPAELAKAVKDFFALPEEERERYGKQGHDFYKAHFRQALVVERIESLLNRMRAKR